GRPSAVFFPFRASRSSSDFFGSSRLVSLGLSFLDGLLDTLWRDKILPLVQIETIVQPRHSQFVWLTPVYDAPFSAGDASSFEHPRHFPHGKGAIFLAFGILRNVAECFRIVRSNSE